MTTTHQSAAREGRPIVAGTTAASRPDLIAASPRARGWLKAIIISSDQAGDFAPFLRWLLVNCMAVVALIALWHFGLIQLMLRTERTHISVLILAFLVITIVHCLIQTLYVSRELIATRRAEPLIAASAGRLKVADGRVTTADGHELEPSVLTTHIAKLVAKAETQGGGHIDQTLLLRSLVDQLRAREKLGWFVAEGLLRLALLGTAVGFILMLIPIAGLSSFDVDTLRSALTGMSGGMAIALNVTVTGIASALLLKLEYYFLDDAIGAVFARITDITEVYVVAALQRGGSNG
jgi:hypothetical protein